jgi:mycothiol system anti-sigma-R factor
MDDCEEILREVYPYLDASLSEAARAEIQHHLDDCLGCLHVFDFHAELQVIIAKKCREQSVPPGLLAKVKDCLGMEASPPPST